MKKCIALLLTGVMLLGLLSGCNTYQNDDSASSAGSTSNTADGVSADFTMAYNGVVTLNPIMSQSSNDFNLFYLTQIQLVRFYGDELQYDAAERYEVSDDYTVYTFHLRDGLKWSDGQALTAHDFEYGAYCLLNPDMGSPAADSWGALTNAAAYNSREITDWAEVGVKALDDLTLEITLERPLNSFDRTIAVRGLYPLRQDFVEQVGSQQLGSSPETMLFSGPYIITDWVLESSMELKKNDLYWDLNSFVGGGIMFLWINQQGTSPETAALLSNQNFRQALNYGFDRSATVNAVNPGYKAYNRLVDSNFAGPDGGKFVDEYPVETVPLSGDVDKAKEYLAAAMEELGYSDVSQLPQLELITWDTSEQKLLLETIIDQWKQNLGLENIQLTQYVIGTAIGSFYDLSYDLFAITWETDVLPTDIMEAMVTGGEVNYGIWSDAQFDSLVEQAINELEPDKQAELTAQAEQIFLDNAAILPLYENGVTGAVQSYVEGFQMSATSSGYQFNHLVVHK